MEGCGARFRPWARGESLVCEFRDSGGQWLCFLCDLIPEIIDDEIKKVQADWLGASQRLTPEELFELIPVTYPKLNQLRTR